MIVVGVGGGGRRLALDGLLVPSPRPISLRHPRPSLQALTPGAGSVWHGGKSTYFMSDLGSDPGSAASCVALGTLLNLSGLRLSTSPTGLAPPCLLGGWAGSVNWCPSACWTQREAGVGSLLPDFSVHESRTRPLSRGWRCWPTFQLFGRAVL